MGGACRTHGGEEKHTERLLEGKRPLGRLSAEWWENVKKGLRNIKQGDVDSFDTG
jgi:hypothetical protein